MMIMMMKRNGDRQACIGTEDVRLATIGGHA